MARSDRLSLYEEIMLLALRNEKGTVAPQYAAYALAGAVMAELLMDRVIVLTDAKKRWVELVSRQPTGDPILDECVRKMADAKRRASLQGWVARLAGIKELRHKVARRLCSRGILRADEDKILLLFTRRIYPEINPRPEREIVERLRAAVFSDRGTVDPRTVVLVSLASSAGLLATTFGRKEMRARRARIAQIVNGEVTGAATSDAIAACEGVSLISVIVAASGN